MSICRTTILETHTKEDADSLLADYIENFDSMFPECTLTLNSRINPTTLISNSVSVSYTHLTLPTNTPV